MRKRGFSPIIIVVLVAAAALAGGYLLLRQGQIGTNLSLPGVSQMALRATEKDFEFVKDPNLRKHFVAQANQTTYRTKTYSSGADLTFVTEVQIKGEDFNTRNIEYDPSLKEQRHKIDIGQTVWVKDYKDGKWWKQTITPEKEKEIPEEEKPAEPTDFKEEYSKTAPKYEFWGKEACPTDTKLTCFKYRETDTATEGLGLTRTFWFDEKKYLLRQEESQVGEWKYRGEYSYDNIDIKAPSPTKEVPEGKSIYDYYYGAEAATPPQFQQLPLPSIPSQEENLEIPPTLE